MHIVVTGASGLVGTYLSKILDFTPLGHKDMDILNPVETKQVIKKLNPDVVVHLAGLTDVAKGDIQKDFFYQVNVIGTRNVALACEDCTMMYWSTEYIFDGEKGNYSEYDTPSPINYYGLTKLLGEYETRYAKNSVIVRTALKPRPYKHSKVPKGIFSTGGYIDDMAREYKLAIQNYDQLPSIINIGLEKKSLADLARETREVEEVSFESLPIKIPRDASLDCSTWNRIKKRLSQS